MERRSQNLESLRATFLKDVAALTPADRDALLRDLIDELRRPPDERPHEAGHSIRVDKLD